MRPILTLALLSTGSLFAQNTFQRMLPADNSIGRKVVTTPGGDVLVAGDRSVFADNHTSAHVVKYTAAGSMIWSTQVIVTSTSYSALLADALGATAAGGALVAGRYYTDFTPDSICIVKLDGSGALLWGRGFEPTVPAATGSRVTHIAEAPNGDVLVCGEISSDNGVVQDDIFLARFSSTGTHLWTKRIVATSVGTVNRTGGILFPSSGGILLLAQTALFSEGSWLMKLDDSGSMQWVKKYNTNDGFADLRPIALFEASTGYDLFYATPFGASGNMLFWINTNSSGDLISSHAYDADNGDLDLSNSVAAAPGGYIVAGNHVYSPPYNIQASMIRFSSSGAVLWAMEYGTAGAETAEAAAATSDGGFLLTGYGEEDSLALMSHTEARGGLPVDQYLVKTDGNGNSFGCETPYAVAMSVEAFTSATYTQNISDITGWNSIALTTTNEYTELSACIELGVTDATSTWPLNVYPNPASGTFTIELPEGGTWRHELVDATGRVLRTIPLRGEQRFTMDLSDLPSGHYLLRSSSTHGRHHTPVIVLH